MTREESAENLYKSSRMLKRFGIGATLGMLSMGAVFYWCLDNIPMGLVFALCSMMFMSIAVVAHVTMKHVKPHMTKTDG